MVACNDLLNRYVRQKSNDSEKYLTLAPKGVVVVWLSGDSKMQIEIGRYQATQIILDSTDVYDSAKFYLEHIVKRPFQDKQTMFYVKNKI